MPGDPHRCAARDGLRSARTGSRITSEYDCNLCLVHSIRFPARAGEVRGVHYDEKWYYGGDVEPKPSGLRGCSSISCDLVCDDFGCVYENGTYTTDGREDYKGE